jgi:hypothetical protein
LTAKRAVQKTIAARRLDLKEDQMDVHAGVRAQSRRIVSSMPVAEGAAEMASDGRTRDTKEVAMRILAASVVIGPLMLIGALPAAAAQSTLALGSGAPIELAAGSDSTADRDTYTHEARDEMREWQRKLNDFSAKAAAKGKEAGNAAENDLNKAWTKAEAASRKLQTASAEGWESAKTSFEEASHELADAWDKIRPQDK